jgi:hypothetical protein
MSQVISGFWLCKICSFVAFGNGYQILKKPTSTAVAIDELLSKHWYHYLPYAHSVYPSETETWRIFYSPPRPEKIFHGLGSTHPASSFYFSSPPLSASPKVVPAPFRSLVLIILITLDTSRRSSLTNLSNLVLCAEHVSQVICPDFQGNCMASGGRVIGH